MAGTGHGRGWLLLVMLVVALLLDARVMRLGGYARTLTAPGGGPGAPQGPPGGVAGRWGADIVEAAAAARAKAHRLRLALTQATTTRRPRLFLQAWAEHRIARDLAARRALDAGPHRWATSALAAAAALAGAWIIYTVVPPVVSELNQRLNGLPAFWFAGILDMLAAVWESMSPTEKAALVLFGAAVVFLSGGTLGLAFSVGLGIATALDAARPTAQLMRDPWGTTGHYLDTHNDLQVITDTGLAAMAIIPGGKALRGAGYATKTARTLTREEAAVEEAGTKAARAAEHSAARTRPQSIAESQAAHNNAHRGTQRANTPTEKPRSADKPGPGTVDERADRGDGRDVKGRYADGNAGAHMYDQSEAKGLEEYLDDLDADGVSVSEVIEDKHLAHINGAPQGRYYDRLIQREDGTWVGLEVKSSQSPYHGTQRAADNMMSPNNPARVRLDDGRTIEITEVQMKRVEKQQ